MDTKGSRSALRTLLGAVKITPHCSPAKTTIIQEVPKMLDKLDEKDLEIESLRKLVKKAYEEGKSKSWMSWSDSESKKELSDIVDKQES